MNSSHFNLQIVFHSKLFHGDERRAKRTKKFDLYKVRIIECEISSQFASLNASSFFLNFNYLHTRILNSERNKLEILDGAREIWGAKSNTLIDILWSGLRDFQNGLYYQGPCDVHCIVKHQPSTRKSYMMKNNTMFVSRESEWKDSRKHRKFKEICASLVWYLYQKGKKPSPWWTPLTKTFRANMESGKKVRNSLRFAKRTNRSFLALKHY
jgi:hypothetical protein